MNIISTDTEAQSKNFNGVYHKKIVGHSGAMTMTEKVYTHLDVEVLINAINKI